MRDDDNISGPRADYIGAQDQKNKSPVDLQQVLMLAASSVGQKVREPRDSDLDAVRSIRERFLASAAAQSASE